MGSTGSGSEWFSGTAAAATGMGILTMALFPFAIPIVLLTIAATLPFVLPLIVVAAVAAILTGAWLGIRAAGRGIRRLVRGRRRPGIPRVQADAASRDAPHALGRYGGDRITDMLTAKDLR
jgi:hypothetical protein